MPGGKETKNIRMKQIVGMILLIALLDTCILKAQEAKKEKAGKDRNRENEEAKRIEKSVKME
jgi:hypothetical protein